MLRPRKPSSHNTCDAQAPPPIASAVPALMQAFLDCNKCLEQHPQDPNTWLGRAECFLKVNYSELAASDAHKTLHLVDREFRAGDETTRSTANTILAQALCDCHCDWKLLLDFGKMLRQNILASIR